MRFDELLGSLESKPQHSELYFEGVNGILLVTDATKPVSFQQIPHWKKQIHEGQLDITVPIVLATTKV